MEGPIVQDQHIVNNETDYSNVNQSDLVATDPAEANQLVLFSIAGKLQVCSTSCCVDRSASRLKLCIEVRHFVVLRQHELGV